MKNKNKNKILIGLSFLILFISLMSAWKTNENRKIVANGFEVMAEIVYAPSDCSRISRSTYCKLRYNDKTFNKRIMDKESCYLVSGKKEIKMLTNNKNIDLLFVNEYNGGDFGFSILFLIFSILGFRQGYKGIKKSESIE